MKTLMKSLVTVCLLFSGVAKTDDSISFESMKQLVGEWSGTLNRTTGEKAALSLSYSLRSNGSALLEESNEDGVEMLTIFNVEQTSMKATHLLRAHEQTGCSINEGLRWRNRNESRSVPKRT